MADEIEVKTKLTLDDLASELLGKIKDEFEDVEEAQDHVQSGAAEWLKTMSAVAVGANLKDIVTKGWEMGTAFFDAANHAYNQQQAVAGLVTTMQGLPWADSREEAEGLHKELQQMAVDIGQPLDDVTQGFEQLLFLTGGTAEGMKHSRDMIREMTVIANVMGKPVAQIASEFGAIRDGSFAATSALGQMVLKTGHITDDLVEANRQWATMTQEQRMEILRKGMTDVADRLGGAEATFDDLLTSMKNLAAVGIESIGEPVVRQLLPVMKDLQNTLMDSAGDISMFAEELGSEIAAFAVDVGQVMKDGLEFAREHGDEIRDAIVTAARTLRETFEFIIENKETLMIIMGARAGAGMVGGGAKLAMGAMGALRGARAAGGVAAGMGALGGAGRAAGGLAGALGAGKAALAAQGPMLALTAALAGVGLAAHQASELYAELNSESDRSEEGLDRLARQEAALREVRAGNTDAAYDLERAIRDGTDAGKAMADQLRETIDNQVQANQELEDQINVGAATGSIGQLVEAYNRAVQDGNTAMASLASQAIFGSQEMANQLLDEATPKITGGIRSMGEHIAESAIDFEKMLHEAQLDAAKKAHDEYWSLKGMKRIWENLPAANVNMSGAKFEIKQEFRDQDPDRVAVVFQRDVLRAAANRLQSRRATIFGV